MMWALLYPHAKGGFSADRVIGGKIVKFAPTILFRMMMTQNQVEREGC